MAGKLFWIWFFILLVLNVIPLGEETSRSLSTRIVSERELFRMDYLLHLISFLAFAWVFVLGQALSSPVFNYKPVLKFSLIVFSAALGFELIQLLLPYRRFNPIDLGFNLAGALLGIVIVFVSSRFDKTKKVVSR